MPDRVHLHIHGTVTGVNFRAWMVEQAENLNLTGWVRNKDEQTVEAVAEGEKEDLEELIDRCHNGPEASWVEKVDIDWEDETGEFDDFRIKY